MINVRQNTKDKLVKSFTKTESESLIRLFHELVGNPVVNGRTDVQRSKLNREKFTDLMRNTFDINDDLFIVRVFREFDKDKDNYVNVKEWIEGLSVFLRGSLDEQIKHCFSVYDLDGDGYISREEIWRMMENSLSREAITDEDPDEDIKHLMELTLKKMDHDEDGRLSYADFEKAVKKDNLLLEAFGNCLPDANRALEFEENTFI